MKSEERISTIAVDPGQTGAPAAKRENTLHLLAFALCIALFLFMRLRWVGHLLVWDEAMNLCSLRALISGAGDFFSNWFWRHPPLFNVLLLPLHPLQTGFAERAELLAVFFGLVNLTLLFALNRKLFGRTVALWSVFLLAVCPGSAFFDVWVKTDHPAATFGLAALLLITRDKPLYAGLSLGLALLSKETGVFYLAAAVLLIAADPARRSLKNLLAVVLTPLITCSWWYIMISMNQPQPGGAAGFASGGLFEHIHFASRKDTGWVNPWDFYFSQLPGILGISGLVLSVIGLVFCFRMPAQGQHQPARFWPVMLLFPAYFILSAIPSKVPWVPMILIPAWITLQAIAVAGCGKAIRNSNVSASTKTVTITAFGAALAILLTVNTAGLEYESYLRRFDAGQWRGASYSRQAALAMNNLIKDEDRVLITDFHYWKGLYPGSPCAVFTYYFERRPLILMRPHDRPLRDLIVDIRTHKIDWALFSPEPDDNAREIYSSFKILRNLYPCRFPGSFLFNTREMDKYQ